MLKKGSMVLGSEMLWVISETVTTALYNGRGGADVVSGMAASFAIANLFFVAFSGITTATGVILGSTLGSGKLDRARQEKRWRRAVKSACDAKAPSMRIASTGEKRPSSLTTREAQSFPEKAVRWVLPVEMSQKQTPPEL